MGFNMLDEELDQLLMQKIQACVQEKHLPEDFTGRLIKNINRRKYIRFAQISLVVALIISLGSALFIDFSARERKSTEHSALIASDRYHREQQKSSISGWVLLGFLRECFKRGKTGKKKEDDIFENFEN